MLLKKLNRAFFLPLFIILSDIVRVADSVLRDSFERLLRGGGGGGGGIAWTLYLWGLRGVLLIERRFFRPERMIFKLLFHVYPRDSSQQSVKNVLTSNYLSS